MTDENDPLFVSARAVKEAVATVYDKVTREVLDGRESEGHTAVLRQPGQPWPPLLTGELTEWEWRVIQFTLLRVGEEA